MDNQHRKIKGYRELNEHEIALMSDIKAEGGRLEKMLNDIGAYLAAQRTSVLAKEDYEELKRLDAAMSTVWLDLATTELKQGIMAAGRAVAQSESF